ncbi:MAG: peptide chain release factor N(5)-glutamine methyltransferase [Chlamydiales bacterium]|nr:peptide chain release factor N(5)-glutamine methyltransferase [Chlamydiales bacterium]
MRILREVLDLTAQYLRDRNDLSPRRHAEELLSCVLKESRLNLYLDLERPLEERELLLLRSLLKRKALGEPIEYISGEIPFFGCHIKVDSRVLIPRQETEVFLEKIAHLLKSRDGRIKEAWDICCGSGCMGLGLKKRFPAICWTLSDLSCDALEVARENSRCNALSVDFAMGDLLAPFQGKRADAVICNPPYISQKEFEALDRSVKDFEPSLALLGGDTGLLFYERLARELPPCLNSGALVFLEIGSTQAEGVLKIFSEGCWKGKRVEKDWAGLDRFFFLEFE